MMSNFKRFNMNSTAANVTFHISVLFICKKLPHGDMTFNIFRY